MRGALITILVLVLIILFGSKVGVENATNMIGASFLLLFVLYLVISLIVYIIKGIGKLFGYGKSKSK